MRNRWLSPLILFMGGVAFVFLLLALNRSKLVQPHKHADAYSAKMELGITYIQSGPPMAGIRLLRKLQQEHPERHEAAFQLGTFSMNTGQYAKAVDWFAKASKAATGQNKVYSLLNWSDALVMTDKKDSARIILKEVLKYSKDSLLLRSVNERLKALE